MVSVGPHECQVQLLHLLTKKAHAQVGALAWRPHSGQQLAVGCSNGVCLWSFGKCPAGGAPALKVAVEGTHQTAWLSFLRAYQTGKWTSCLQSCAPLNIKSRGDRSY